MSLCKVCQDPLVLPLDPEDDDASSTVPDDVQLQCSCHYHWQCLLDQSSELMQSLQCPSCSTPLSKGVAGSSSRPAWVVTQGTSILARYVNEGGVQDNLDILPSIVEEAYLEANPEARPARAFHVMCSTGDVMGMVELLHDVSNEVDDLGALIRYQDPLSNMASGLHLAIEHGHEEVLWLLLWLSSGTPEHDFPSEARRIVERMAIGRLQVTQDTDVRSLRDADGRTPRSIAQLQGNFGNVLDFASWPS